MAARADPGSQGRPHLRGGGRPSPGPGRRDGHLSTGTDRTRRDHRRRVAARELRQGVRRTGARLSQRPQPQQHPLPGGGGADRVLPADRRRGGSLRAPAHHAAAQDHASGAVHHRPPHVAPRPLAGRLPPARGPDGGGGADPPPGDRGGSRRRRRRGPARRAVAERDGGSGVPRPRGYRRPGAGDGALHRPHQPDPGGGRGHRHGHAPVPRPFPAPPQHRRRIRSDHAGPGPRPGGHHPYGIRHAGRRRHRVAGRLSQGRSPGAGLRRSLR